jgi:hypothetical protein
MLAKSMWQMVESACSRVGEIFFVIFIAQASVHHIVDSLDCTSGVSVLAQVSRSHKYVNHDSRSIQSRNLVGGVVHVFQTSVTSGVFVLFVYLYSFLNYCYALTFP